MNTSPSMTALLIALCAGAFAVGSIMVVYGIPKWRRPNLAGRVEPYIRSPYQRSRLLEHGNIETKELLRNIPLLGSLSVLTARMIGGNDTITRRLHASGSKYSVQQYRVSQTLWAIGGIAACSLICVLLSVQRGTIVAGAIVIIPMGAFIGAWLRDASLQQAIDQRKRKIMMEFPSVAEFLVLAVSAGESPLAAIDRVARSCKGELITEFVRMRANIFAGATLQTAMQQMGRRVDLPALDKFIDGIIIALERGSPLVDVLRAQAQDVREESKRALFVSGGKKESLMLVPVVFFILPVIIVFAVFPGAVVFSINI